MATNGGVGSSPPVDAAAPEAPFGVTRLEVQGFRTARDVSFGLRSLCALVGEASAGKSNLLAAARAALDPATPRLTAADATEGGDGRISIHVTLAGKAEAVLEARPDHQEVTRSGEVPPALFLPADSRAGHVAPAGLADGPAVSAASELFRVALSGQDRSSAARAHSLVDAVEAGCERRLSGLVLLVEEPELYLRPQAQRYLYRLLREFTATGNQVIYSTHSPAFLNVTRLDEIVFVERLSTIGTRASHAAPVTADEDFRVLTEFDVSRSELFLARAVVLVEGLTEKIVLPLVFASLGHDVDRDGISIVECGGKPNIALFARICRAAGIPFVVVHDSDRKKSGRLAAAERALNALILETAGEDRVFVLDPDFEAIAGLVGHSRKPERAWREFARRSAAEMPPELLRVAERTLADR